MKPVSSEVGGSCICSGEWAWVKAYKPTQQHPTEYPHYNHDCRRPNNMLYTGVFSEVGCERYIMESWDVLFTT